MKSYVFQIGQFIGSQSVQQQSPQQFQLKGSNPLSLGSRCTFWYFPPPHGPEKGYEQEQRKGPNTNEKAGLKYGDETVDTEVINE